jgi:hypothetical protein
MYSTKEGGRFRTESQPSAAAMIGGIFDEKQLMAWIKPADELS